LIACSTASGYRSRSSGCSISLPGRTAAAHRGLLAIIFAAPLTALRLAVLRDLS
jgi:hypothetical protein